MPKTGEKVDDRPYVLRCRVCKHPVQKLVSRVNLFGEAAAHAYLCPHGCHCGERCGEREGCEPERHYDGELGPKPWTVNGGRGAV